MRVSPEITALRRWRLWGWGLLIGEIVWFAIMRPRFSGNLHAVFVLSLVPLAVVGYVYLLAAISAYLEEREWEYWFRQLIVVMLGLSVGLFLSALMWLTESQVEG